MKKIVIFQPYFGKLRNDFYFWLKSVEFNSSIDFVLFTDQEIIAPPKKNIQVVKCSLPDIEILAKKNVWGGCQLYNPYKLCDYRPAYAEIFKDYVVNYDFWGFCDCDIILGDIRHFITDEILERHDRILSRGHLSLFRNDRETNGFYRKMSDPAYTDVFTSEKSFKFDEWTGTSDLWRKEKEDKFYDEIIFDDISTYIYSFFSAQKRNQEKNRKNFMFSFDNGKLWRYFEENGNVIREETLYVHFQRRNMKVCTSVSSRFSMIPNKYVGFVENVSVDYLRKNIRTSPFWAYKERVLQKVSKLLGQKQNRAYLTLWK